MEMDGLLLQSVCLLCPKRIITNSNKNYENHEETHVSFKNLMKYLNMGLSGVALNSEVLIESLCEECISLANLFGGIYQDFEKARVLLQGCVGIVKEQVEKGIVPPEGNGVEVEGGAALLDVNDFKARILKQCSLKLKSTPKVELTRVDDTTGPKHKHTVIMGIPAEAQDDSACEKTDSGGNNGSSTTTGVKGVPAVPPQPHVHTKSGRFCSFCGLKSAHPSSNRKHMVSVHPTKYFPQLGKVREKDLARVIKEVCDKGYIARVGLPLPRRSQCHFCKTITGDKSQRYHLLSNHQGILMSVLEGRLDLVNLASTRPVLPRKVFKCQICGKAYLFQANLTKHVELHNQYYLTREGSFTCAHCGYSSTTSKYKMDAHVRRVHYFQHYAKELPPGTTEEMLEDSILQFCENWLKPVGSGRSGRSFHCKLCSKECVGSKKIHILEKHFQVVRTTVKSLL